MRNGERDMKTKKHISTFVFALTCAILFAACNNFFEPEIHAPIESGYGKISVSLTGGGAARTVMPSAVFDKYTYIFTKEGEEDGTEETPDDEGYFLLEGGYNYTVEVQAFIGTGEPYTLAASGASELFYVYPGYNDPVEVLLSGLDTEEEGKFSYTITYPEGAAAEITLQKWPDMDAVTLNPASLAGGNGITETLDLEIGSYLLTVVIRKDDLYAGKNEAVHIYPLIVTEYAKDFLDDDLVVAIPPTANAAGTALSMPGVWADGSVSANGEQWFTFTATADTQYIHATFGTLANMDVQLYDSIGNKVGNQENLTGSTTYVTETVTSGQVYYIRVTPHSGSSGAYQMTINTSATTPSPTTTLNVGDWTDGAVSAYGEQWFKFTATASAQYLHFDRGDLGDLYVQLYDSTGSPVGVQSNIHSGSGTYLQRPVTSGQVYYVKVTPAASHSGAYKIAYNTTITFTPVANVNETELTADTWTDGTVSADSEQWYKFTATAATQFIHASFGTLTDLYVRLYDIYGSMVGDISNLYNSTTYVPKSLTNGQMYYIRVTPYSSSYSGTYKIAFNTVPASPGTTVTALIAGVWADGNINSSTGEQWFRFTATASYTQYIHASFGTLTSLYVQVYNSNGDTVGSRTNLSGSTGNTTYNTWSVTSGQVYYIKVTPYSSSYSGAYKIAFNTSSYSPSPIITLTANTWADGNINSSIGEQWFTFTATADAQYIHAGFGTLTDLYVRVYNLDGSTVGSQTELSGSTTYVSETVTSGQTYYIKVTRYSSYSGTYRIVFNTSTTPPVPSNSAPVTTLTANTWANGNIAADGEQWFKFTATADTQFIHADCDTLSYFNVQVYDSTGSTVGSMNTLYDGNTFTTRSVTSGQVYYIKVTPYSSYSGTYKIAFNAVPAPPGATVTTLSVGDWTNGEIQSSGGEEWFKFTATSYTQYIHANFNTLDSSYGLYVQVYNLDGSTVGSQTRLYGSNTYTSRSVNEGDEYYVKVTPYNSDYSGTYQIAHNTSSSFEPVASVTATTLTADTWTDGSVSTDSEKWYKFTATAATQFIHASFGTLTSLYVQLYDSTGSTVSGNTYLTGSTGGTAYTSGSLTSGQEYYVKVTPYSSYSGTYKIAFNTVPAPPGAKITQLSDNEWTEGNLPVNGEHWYTFTATAYTQRISVNFDTLTNLYVQVYDTYSNTYSQTNLTGSTGGTAYVTISLTIGEAYYVKVTPYNSYYSGTYQIKVFEPVARYVTIAMRDSFGDGWNGCALRINVNGSDYTSVTLSSGSSNTYDLSFYTGDVIRLYWVSGSYQGEVAFIVYYTNTPPSPTFTPSSWSGSNALIYRLYSSMNSVSGGTLLGSFTVQ